MKKILDQLSIINFLVITIAGIINAIGVTMFLAPVNLYDSGISGTSMLFAQMTPDFMTLSIFLILLNFPLFVFGMKKQGSVFTIYSLYAVAVYSILSTYCRLTSASHRRWRNRIYSCALCSAV